MADIETMINLKEVLYSVLFVAGDGIETVNAPGVCGNWFRLRAEYITVSEGQVKVAVYYNDMKVAESAPFIKLTSTPTFS